MEEWKECRLGEICTKITDGSHFSSQACQTGYPMFSVKDMLEYGFDYSNCKHISAKDFESMKNGDCVPQKGDILVAKDGSFLKQIFECKETKEEAILSSIAMFRPNQDFITPTFLCYLLKSPKVYNYIASNCVSGSALPRIVLKDFKKVSMQVPPLSTQQKIAAILSSLDDKIELNNKINTNLEQQAGALFKNWFVDFEPFGGKMPDGWKVGKLSEIGTIVGGSTPSKAKKEYYTNKGIAWITPKDLSNDKSKFISHGEIDITELGFKNSSAIKMPKGTVLYSSRAPIGYIAISKNEVTTNQGFKSVIPNPNVGNAYIYYFLRSNFELIDNMASGSTFKEISGTAMKNVPVLIPDDKTLFNFQTMCETLFSQQELLENENGNLSTIRDTLLSKLMNGEIEVNEVSK